MTVRVRVEPPIRRPIEYTESSDSEAAASSPVVPIEETIVNIENNPGAEIPLDSLPNLRDLGGWQTNDGRVIRYGNLFRSTALDKLSPEDAKVLDDQIGIRNVYDLRTAGEVASAPDRIPTGVRFMNLDVLADDATSAQANIGDLLGDPVAAEKELGGGKNAATYAKGYKGIVLLPSAVEGYGRLYRSFLEPDGLAALFHCTTGKDRTGWAAAALLLLLGVSEEDVFREFMLTNEQLLPRLQPVFDKFAAAGGDPDLLLPLLGVQRDYLETALREMRAHFGTIDAYFRDGLGIDDAAKNRLRELLTTEIDR